MSYMPIVMDGTTYYVRIKADPSLEEYFRVKDGDNAMTLLSGEYSRDVLGTYYDHTIYVEPDPKNYASYTAFYSAISAPVDYHQIQMPHGTGSITYKAMVTSGSHKLREKLKGNRIYTGLQVNFRALAPYRTP